MLPLPPDVEPLVLYPLTYVILLLPPVTTFVLERELERELDLLFFELDLDLLRPALRDLTDALLGLS
jgi:hypothetical protein